MDNKKHKMIVFLLENANPSIKRRIKNEVLNNITPDESMEYQEQILQEPLMQQIIVLQQSNGWIGKGSIRNFDMPHGALNYLAEKAIDKNSSVLKHAMDAFVEIPLSDPCYGPSNERNVDEFKHPCAGVNLARCACIARAGYDDIINISPQIQLAVDSFKRVIEIDSIFDILHPEKKGGKVRNVFNDYEKWPCRYHLDMLAHTQSWKNKVNIQTVADSVIKMMKTDDPELISYVPNGQAKTGCVGGVFPVQGLTVMGSGIYPSPILCEVGSNGKDYNGKYHFELIEWFARCGIVSHVPSLRKIVSDIANSIDNDGVCRLPSGSGVGKNMIAEDVFKNWNKFGGLQLEVDWKSKTRKLCDITFRALLILHYSKFKEVQPNEKT